MMVMMVITLKLKEVFGLLEAKSVLCSLVMGEVGFLILLPHPLESK